MNKPQPSAGRSLRGRLRAGLPFVFVSLILAGACASAPPPPPPAQAAPVVEAPRPAAPEAPPAVAEEAAPAAVEPECQAAEDCKKLRDPAAGMQWMCENARCLEQPAPEPPQAEATAQPPGAETTEKGKKGKAKGKQTAKPKN
jgi:hypothetical protein